MKIKGNFDYWMYWLIGIVTLAISMIFLNDYAIVNLENSLFEKRFGILLLIVGFVLLVLLKRNVVRAQLM
jgi:hypothetical protein